MYFFRLAWSRFGSCLGQIVRLPEFGVKLIDHGLGVSLFTHCLLGRAGRSTRGSVDGHLHSRGNQREFADRILSSQWPPMCDDLELLDGAEAVDAIRGGPGVRILRPLRVDAPGSAEPLGNGASAAINDTTVLHRYLDHHPKVEHFKVLLL